jgi:hypothetical protein
MLQTGVYGWSRDYGLLWYICRYGSSQASRSQVQGVLTCAIWSSAEGLLVLLIFVCTLLLLVQFVNSLLCRLDRLGLLWLVWLLGEPLAEAAGIDAMCSVGQAHDRVPSVVLM